jgi:hypothetical protein
MKAAFLSSTLISKKGDAAPASPSRPPEEILTQSRRAESIMRGSFGGGQTRTAPPRDIHRTVTVPARPRAEAPATTEAATGEPRVRAEAPAPAAPPRAHDLLKQQSEYAELRKLTDSMTRDNFGRVRISVRMAPEQHLRLKLIAAHSQMSAQSIIEQALEEFVQRHGDLIPNNCACI